MKLEDFATDLVASNRFIKASFGGFAGSGKTRTATEFIIGCYSTMEIDKNKPLLFIDNEKGSRFLIPLLNKHGIKCIIKETDQLDDILSAFDFLQKGEIGFLFIDSLSKVWYKYIEQYMIAFGTYKDGNRKKQFMTLNDWGNVIPEWGKVFAQRFVSVEGNCIFTGRGGNTYEMEEMEENGKTKKQFVKSGVKMKMAGETPFEPDINVWMEQCQELDDNGRPVIWREALIMKDRSGIIDGKTFKNPVYEDFKPVVDFLCAVPVGHVAGSSSDKSLAPSENSGLKYDKRQVEIEMEKIKNAFDFQGFGTSGADKQMKVRILESCFGTSSGTEMNTMKHDDLKKGREIVDSLFDSEHWKSGKSIENIDAFFLVYNSKNELDFDTNIT